MGMEFNPSPWASPCTLPFVPPSVPHLQFPLYPCPTLPVSLLLPPSLALPAERSCSSRRARSCTSSRSRAWRWAGSRTAPMAPRWRPVTGAPCRPGSSGIIPAWKSLGRFTPAPLTISCRALDANPGCAGVRNSQEIFLFQVLLEELDGISVLFYFWSEIFVVFKFFFLGQFLKMFGFSRNS